MLFQTNPAFPKEVQKYGCYFMSLLRMVELVSLKEFTVDQINALYTHSVWKGYIIGKCSCDKPDNIVKEAFSMLLSKNIAYQVGSKSYGTDPKTVWWPWVMKNDKFKQADYLLGQFATTGEFGTHYCLLDRNEVVIYDPYDKPYTRLDLLGSHIYRVL